MNTIPSLEVIHEVVSSQLEEQVRSRSAEILGTRNTISGWGYLPIPGGATALNVVILEMEGQKVVLKIGKEEKLLQDAETEESISRDSPGIVPLVLGKGEGVSPDGKPYFWILQEFIPGVRFQDYIKSHPITDAHRKNLALQLGAIHQIGPGEPFFGKILAPPEKRHADFPAYIQYFENCISSSPDFPQDRKERILSAITLLREKIASKVIKPCLIHGDFSDRNILVRDETNVQIIDFGDAKWSIRETEFAVMMTHHGALKDIDMYREIISTYEEMWGPLDEDLFDLSSLCHGAFKTVRRLMRNSPDPGVWNKIIEPILLKIEQSSVS